MPKSLFIIMIFFSLLAPTVVRAQHELADRTIGSAPPARFAGAPGNAQPLGPSASAANSQLQIHMPEGAGPAGSEPFTEAWQNAPSATTPTGADRPLVLAPPGPRPDSAVGGRAPPTTSSSIATVVGSLAIVLGLFFAFAWIARRAGPKGARQLPSEVVSVLGHATLSPRQQMQLVRVGDKLVLLAVAATGVQTLTEITDPQQVERLQAACAGERSGNSFQQVLGQLGTEPAAGGFFGRSDSNSSGAAPAGRERARA